MARKKIRVVLLGAGTNMRDAHVRRIMADGRVAIVGVADPVRAQADLLMERYGDEIPYYASWRTLLKAEHAAQIRRTVAKLLFESPLSRLDHPIERRRQNLALVGEVVRHCTRGALCGSRDVAQREPVEG